MKALISPNEDVYDNTIDPPVYLGQRIAQVELEENVFEVSAPLYWIPCEDYVNGTTYYYNANKKLFLEIPTTTNQSNNLIET